MAFSVNRNEIITEAIAECGSLDPSDNPSGEEIDRGSKRLNMMVKAWMAEGANLWRREEVTCFVETSQSVYTFGTDHITTSYEETTLSASASASATSVSVTSASGLSLSDYFCVRLDDGTLHWTTIASIASTTIGLDDALPSAAASGNIVYSYTTKASSPKKILVAYRRDTSGNDTRVFIQGRVDYERLANKSSQGEITQIHHDPQVSASKIVVWPLTSETTNKLVMVVDRPFTDFGEATDVPDFPEEWYEALYLGLADKLAPAYGLAIPDRRELERRARDAFDRAKDFDVEEASLRFEFDTSGR